MHVRDKAKIIARRWYHRRNLQLSKATVENMIRWVIWNLKSSLLAAITSSKHIMNLYIMTIECKFEDIYTCIYTKDERRNLKLWYPIEKWNISTEKMRVILIHNDDSPNSNDSNNKLHKSWLKLWIILIWICWVTE